MQVSNTIKYIMYLLICIQSIIIISCSTSYELLRYSDVFTCCIAEGNSDKSSMKKITESIDRIEKELLDAELLEAKSGQGYKKFLIDFFILEKFNSEDLLKQKYFGCDEVYGIEIGLRMDICYDYLDTFSECIGSPSEIEILKYYMQYKHSEISKFAFDQKIKEIPKRNYKNSVVKIIIIYEFCNS